MSAWPPVRRPMMLDLPENGYESSRSLPDNGTLFANGTENAAETNRKRKRIRTIGNNRGKKHERTDVSDSDFHQNGRSGAIPTRQEMGEIRKLGYRDRVSCYTWTWFTMTMATGGIANVLRSVPYRAQWLNVVGIIFMLLNMVLFLINCLLITLRFRWNSGSFKASFTNQSESLFIPACIVSVGIILTNICQYGIPEAGEWLQTTMEACFWSYVAVSFIASSSIYLILWSTQTFPIHTMTPIWVFPAYPLLLVAPIAANFIDFLPNAAAASRVNSIAIALAAVCIQGTGFLLSLMIYSAFIYRLMTQKLPRETTRPGMFVSVGPSGFTVAGLVHLGNTVMPKILPGGYMGSQDVAPVLKLLSNLLGLALWGLCLWFFAVSLGAHWQVMNVNDPDHHIHFDMTWYSFVFPNTALITATQALGSSLGSPALQIFGTVLTAMLVLVWFFVFGMMVRALILKRLLWPPGVQGKDGLGIRHKATTGSAGIP